MFSSRFRSGTALIAVLSTLLSIGGCSKAPERAAEAPRRGDVFGKVLLKGQPVPKGTTITFVPAEGGYPSVTGTIDEKGLYSVSNVPCDQVKVMVTAPAMAAGGTLTVPSQPVLGGGIPVKYTSVVTSGETVEVKEKAKVEYNLDMREP